MFSLLEFSKSSVSNKKPRSPDPHDKKRSIMIVKIKRTAISRQNSLQFGKSSSKDTFEPKELLLKHYIFDSEKG